MQTIGGFAADVIGQRGETFGRIVNGYRKSSSAHKRPAIIVDGGEGLQTIKSAFPSVFTHFKVRSIVDGNYE